MAPLFVGTVLLNFYLRRFWKLTSDVSVPFVNANLCDNLALVLKLSLMQGLQLTIMEGLIYLKAAMFFWRLHNRDLKESLLILKFHAIILLFWLLSWLALYYSHATSFWVFWLCLVCYSASCLIHLKLGHRP